LPRRRKRWPSHRPLELRPNAHRSQTDDARSVRQWIETERSLLPCAGCSHTAMRPRLSARRVRVGSERGALRAIAIAGSAARGHPARNRAPPRADPTATTHVRLIDDPHWVALSPTRDAAPTEASWLTRPRHLPSGQAPFRQQLLSSALGRATHRTETLENAQHPIHLAGCPLVECDQVFRSRGQCRKRQQTLRPMQSPGPVARGHAAGTRAPPRPEPKYA
jgi:hypothetical protein